MRTRIITALTAALLLGVTGCSSDSDDKKERSDKPAVSATPSKGVTNDEASASDRAALEKAVREYTAAYFKPDVDAGYAMVSRRCKEATSKEQFEVMLERASGDYGQQDVRRFSVDQLSGDMARVSYGVALPKFDQKQQPWVRESGQWRYDSC
ncbi:MULTISPECIES: hypothetical protein [unclassified Streptomyces]|uniref:hypothetical protein n=1 Tax=unclassified Streptomyces TaxID=2593676 RepID=UPI002DD8D124|nr:hypothetical protein [Streptomyces sp. NBC_01750]WSB00659.1 hypothetical protein OIE54_15910 [Streptomyces sp. NBC_01794]WSD34984.1 hypothetical protein OG966_25705 [Streptomyces sp. NBC_01750]